MKTAKSEGWVIAQAVALKFMGLKGDGNDPRYYRVYANKEEARDSLASLLYNIKQEQGIGWRTKDNLEPKKSLDFYIQKIYTELPIDEMEKRGWIFEQSK